MRRSWGYFLMTTRPLRLGRLVGFLNARKCLGHKARSVQMTNLRAAATIKQAKDGAFLWFVSFTLQEPECVGRFSRSADFSELEEATELADRRSAEIIIP